MRIKKALTLSVAAMALLLAACVSQPTGQFESLEDLIAEGIIAPFDPENLQMLDINLSEVTRGNVYQTMGFEVNIVFPHTYHLHFESETLSGGNSTLTALAWDYGYFSGMYFRVDDPVTEGDFIAELTFDVPESVVIARHALELELRQFEVNFEADQQRRRQEINAMQTSMRGAEGDEREILSLRIRLAELGYTQFITNAENSRQQFADRLENINAPVETERLYAPVTGHITWTTHHNTPRFLRDLAPTGNMGRRVASIRDSEYMHFVATGTLDGLRYGELVQVTRTVGEASFYAQVITDPLTHNMVREGTHTVRLMPLDGEFERFLQDLEVEMGNHFDPDTIIDFLTLRARPVLPIITDGILVERRAIQEEAGRQFVLLYENGAISRRYILTGATGSIDVPIGETYNILQVAQILSGLNPGQWVVIP